MKGFGPGVDGYYDVEVIAAVRANRDRLDDTPAALVHGDPATPNGFVTDDGVGFLDWEIAHIGDPAREIRRTLRQQVEPRRGEANDRLVSAFHDGYREEAGELPVGYEDRRPVYHAVTFLGTVGFFEKWEQWEDDPTEELASWASGEMDSRLAAIR